MVEAETTTKQSPKQYNLDMYLVDTVDAIITEAQIRPAGRCHFAKPSSSIYTERIRGHDEEVSRRPDPLAGG
jgi:hypothetical protein